MPASDWPRRLLKILYIVEATLAGTGRHVLDLVHALLAHGHEVHIVYSPVRMEECFASELAGLADVHAFAWPISPEVSLSDISAVRTVRRYIREKGPFDVVHGHSSKGGAIARIAAVGLGIPKTVYTPHAFRTQDPNLGTFRRWVYAATEAFLGRFFSDNIIATSGEELAHGITIGIPRRRLTIVHNVARRPSDLPDRAKARQSFGVAENDFLLVYVGRLSAQKAPQRFIDLVGAIRRGTPRLRALMLGYGELEAEIRRQIDSAHLGDVVSLHVDRRGWDAMAAADLFVLTSRYEGMPYTLLEAATLGVPILTTSVGGVSAVTALGVSIRVVPESIGNEEFAQAACEFIATKFSSEPSRQCVLDLNTMIEETLSVYCQNRSRECRISCCGYGKRCLPDQKNRDQFYLDVSTAKKCDDSRIQTSSIVYESLS